MYRIEMGIGPGTRARPGPGPAHGPGRAVQSENVTGRAGPGSDFQRSGRAGLYVLSKTPREAS